MEKGTYDNTKFLTEEGVKALTRLRENLQTHIIEHFKGSTTHKIPCNEKMFGMPDLNLESVSEVRHRIKFINHLLGNGEEVIIK